MKNRMENVLCSKWKINKRCQKNYECFVQNWSIRKNIKKKKTNSKKSIHIVSLKNTSQQINIFFFSF